MQNKKNIRFIISLFLLFSIIGAIGSELNSPRFKRSISKFTITANNNHSQLLILLAEENETTDEDYQELVDVSHTFILIGISVIIIALTSSYFKFIPSKLFSKYPIYIHLRSLKI